MENQVENQVENQREIKGLTANDFREQGRKKDTPLIAWTINDNCQLRCSYCYVDLKRVVQPDLDKTARTVLYKLKRIKHNFDMELLGGEPTIHANYNEIIEELVNMPYVNIIKVDSNMKQPLSFWENHIKSDKVSFLFSIHLEYADSDLEEKLIYLIRNFDTECLVMVHPNKKYIPKTREIFDLLDRLNIHYEITYLYDDDRVIMTYDKEITDMLEERKDKHSIPYVFQNGTTQYLSVDEIYNNGLHNFQGWICYNQYYTITKDGYIGKACTDKQQHIITFKDFDWKPLTCGVKNGCICDEYLEWKKYNDEYL